MLKCCDANTDPNDRDYGFYHNGAAIQARPLQGNQFPTSESPVVGPEEGWGGCCGRGIGNSVLRF